MDHIIKQEIKTEVMDQVIKQEIKTEIEEITRKSHSFICPTCKAHFLYYDEFFIEHVREHHGDISGEKIISNELPSSSESQVIEKFNNTPKGCKRFKCDVCSYSCSYKSIFLKHKIIHTGEKPYKCKEYSYMLVLKNVI